MAFQRTSWKITNTSNKFLMKTNWHMAWITNSNTMSAFAVFSHLKEISSRIGNTTKKFSLILSRLKVKLELSISCRLWLYISLESINQSLENLPKHSWKNLLTNQFSAKSFCFNGTTKKFVLIKNAKFTIKKPRRNSVISSKISLSGWKKPKRKVTIIQTRMKRLNQQPLTRKLKNNQKRRTKKKKKLKKVKLNFEPKKNKKKWLKNKERLKPML